MFGNITIAAASFIALAGGIAWRIPFLPHLPGRKQSPYDRFLGRPELHEHIGIELYPKCGTRDSSASAALPALIQTISRWEATQRKTPMGAVVSALASTSEHNLPVEVKAFFYRDSESPAPTRTPGTSPAPAHTTSGTWRFFIRARSWCTTTPDEIMALAHSCGWQAWETTTLPEDSLAENVDWCGVGNQKPTGLPHFPDAQGRVALNPLSNYHQWGRGLVLDLIAAGRKVTVVSTHADFWLNLPVDFIFAQNSTHSGVQFTPSTYDDHAREPDVLIWHVPEYLSPDVARFCCNIHAPTKIDIIDDVNSKRWDWAETYIRPPA